MKWTTAALTHPSLRIIVVATFACLAMLLPQEGQAADQPQWGQLHSRNMVSQETGLPDDFDPGKRERQTGQIVTEADGNVNWVVRLGSMTYTTPIVAEGKIFVGTDNYVAHDPRIEGDRGVMLCLDEATGKLLWQLNVPKMNDEIKFSDWHHCGISSTPAVEKGRAYLVTNRCEVVCIDLQGMANGNDGPYNDEGQHMVPAGDKAMTPGKKDADIIWRFDMVGELGVRPHNASSSSVLIDGDLLYVGTSNGVDWTHSFVIDPKAPSLIVLNKRTGKLVARDDFDTGLDITHGQWSSPAMATIGDRRLCFFGAGNGVLYGVDALDPKRLPSELLRMKPVFQLNGNPLAQTQATVPADHQHDSTSYEVTAMPVVYKNRVYATFTQEAFHGMKQGQLCCIDPTQTGDTTRTGIVWSYDAVGACVATVAIDNGLLYTVGFDGVLHCLDAETGRPLWTHKVGRETCASPLIADGKIYLGTGTRTFWILAAGRELNVIRKIRMRDEIFATATAANGKLYVATKRDLYSIGK